MTESPQPTDLFSPRVLLAIKKQAAALASKHAANWALVYRPEVKEWRVVFTPRQLDEVVS
jgi:hypothetical protein